MTNSQFQNLNVPAGFQPRPLKRLDNAMLFLRKTGLPIPASSVEDKPVTGLVKELTTYNGDAVNAIIKTLSHAQIFNTVVREQLDGTSIGQEYTKIAQSFDSIREDAKTMVANVEDGQVGFKERLSEQWMNWTRGSIPDRFKKISVLADDVFRQTEHRLSQMQAILEGYAEYRGSVKEALILAEDLLKQVESHYQNSNQMLKNLQEAIEINEIGSQDRNLAELQRDDAARILRQADRHYQIAKDLRDNLTISYNTGDMVMARLTQTAQAQERVWSQSATFFTTNESVLTALSASFTMLKGLHASTQTHVAIKEGINNALKDLGQAGTSVQERALREGYGPTISHEAVKGLVDSIVDYQVRSKTIIAEMRQEADENQRKIAEDTEKARVRLIELMSEPTA